MTDSLVLASKLVAYRHQRGLSQENLAEAANLSLRTVQRLEKGESLARGYTLQALAAALQVPVEDLTATAAPAAQQLPEPAPEVLPSAATAPPTTSVPAYVALMWLSAFSYVLLPGANIILPLWLRYRRRHEPVIRAAGSQLLNFELAWSLFTYGGYLLLLAAQIALLFHQVVVVWTPLVFLVVLHFVHAPLLLLGAWRARRGQYGGYPVGLRLF